MQVDLRYAAAFPIFREDIVSDLWCPVTHQRCKGYVSIAYVVPRELQAAANRIFRDPPHRSIVHEPKNCFGANGFVMDAVKKGRIAFAPTEPHEAGKEPEYRVVILDPAILEEENIRGVNWTV
jgi:hypothetical protein